MMKKILTIVFFAVAFLSCENMFEPDKDNDYDLERALKDPAFAQGILDKAYALMDNEYDFDDVATDNAVSNSGSNVFSRMAKGEWSSSFNPMNKWQTSYDALFNINTFLSIVEKVEWSWSSPERNELYIQRFKGEALALRAYYYIQLLQNHGGKGADGAMLGVPLVTQPLKSTDNWRLPRNTYQECLTQILSDLDEAFPLLPYKWGVNNSYDTSDDYNLVFGSKDNNINQHRVNGQAVKALKARILLHAASPAFNNGEYNLELCKQAATIASELLKDIRGILDSGGILFFDQNNDADRAEILWRNNYFNSGAREKRCFPPSLFGNGDVNPTQDLVDAFPMSNGYPINHPSSGYNPDNPYAGRDTRLRSFIVFNRNPIGTDTIRIDNTTNNGVNKTFASTKTGYYLLKLMRADVNLDPTINTQQRHFYTHIRFTEIFLIYAEAANELWGPDADPEGLGYKVRTIIANLRFRARIPRSEAYLASITTKEDMREVIRNERRLELCFEGYRFWDLRRWGMSLNNPVHGVNNDGTTYSVFKVEDRNYQPFMKFGPIPNQETLKYDLVQNEGW